MPDDLDGMTTFVAVADARGVRAAAARLGVSHTAVSQALRRLEERLGVALVRRTTRSVHLTEAGAELYAAVRPALDDVRAAVVAAGARSREPRGALRLLVATGADEALGGPVLAGFVAAHPHVRLQVDVTNAVPDIVAAGYDAGIRLGEVIDRDMVAVPLTGDLRLVVVGAPEYFARHPAPTHPRDLVAHACINWHPTPEAPPYRWEFTDPADGRDFSVDVGARVLTNDPALLVRLARAGAGLIIAFDGQVADDVARGDLVPVLEAFSAPFAGFYLYYPQRRQASAPLRALIDHLRDARRPARARRLRP